MMSTISISKKELSKLSEDVLRLISLGKYTLYKASSKEIREIAYVLRTGAKDFFILDINGQPLDVQIESFEIQAKMTVEDIPSSFVVSNFNLT